MFKLFRTLFSLGAPELEIDSRMQKFCRKKFHERSYCNSSTDSKFRFSQMIFSNDRFSYS